MVCREGYFGPDCGCSPRNDSTGHFTSDTIVCLILRVQWNPSLAATLGEQHFGRYIGEAFIEGLFVYTNYSFRTWVPGRYIAVGLIQGWPIRGVPLYSVQTRLLWS